MAQALRWNSSNRRRSGTRGGLAFNVTARSLGLAVAAAAAAAAGAAAALPPPTSCACSNICGAFCFGALLKWDLEGVAEGSSSSSGRSSSRGAPLHSSRGAARSNTKGPL